MRNRVLILGFVAVLALSLAGCNNKETAAAVENDSIEITAENQTKNKVEDNVIDKAEDKAEDKTEDKFNDKAEDNDIEKNDDTLKQQTNENAVETEPSNSIENATDSALKNNSKNQSGQSKPVVIAIDPGHGGENELKSHGVEYDYYGVHVMEKTLNYTIACKLADYLRQAGVTVVMTRTGDYDVSIPERVAIGKKANVDYFVSVHNNSSSRGLATDNGCMILCTQSHYNGVYDDSVAMAKSILPYLQGLGLNLSSDWDVNSTGGLLQRPRQSEKYPDGSPKDYYGIIAGCTEAQIPSIIIEHAFLSSPTDYAMYLSNDIQLDALARADANGIIDFLRAKGQL